MRALAGAGAAPGGRTRGTAGRGFGPPGLWTPSLVELAKHRDERLDPEQLIAEDLAAENERGRALKAEQARRAADRQAAVAEREQLKRDRGERIAEAIADLNDEQFDRLLGRLS